MKMRKIGGVFKSVFSVFLVVLLFCAVLPAVLANPWGANVTREADSRLSTFTGNPTQVAAQAGNVTQLTINASAVTDRWQGYYGNITGSITLDTAAGYTLYDWDALDLNVAGEVYAANDSVTDWTDVICVNLNGAGTLAADGINSTNLEGAFGTTYLAGDGFNKTFTQTDDIVIGTNTLSSCHATHLYVNNASQSAQWNETLLTENATGAVIFATEVEQNTVGFDGNAWDFQMIVAENGDVTDSTTYYFYVELA